MSETTSRDLYQPDRVGNDRCLDSNRHSGGRWGTLSVFREHNIHWLTV